MLQGYGAGLRQKLRRSRLLGFERTTSQGQYSRSTPRPMSTISIEIPAWVCGKSYSMRTQQRKSATLSEHSKTLDIDCSKQLTGLHSEARKSIHFDVQRREEWIRGFDLRHALARYLS